MQQVVADHWDKDGVVEVHDPFCEDK